MFKVFFLGTRGARLHALLGAAGLIAFLIAQNLNAVAFNIWNGTFFDTLAHASEQPEGALWMSLIYLASIAAGDVVLNTGAGYLAALYTVWWREALTDHYVPLWREAGERIEGASQRIQQDPGELASIVEAIGLDLVRSALALLTFLPLLIALSTHITVGFFAWSGSLALLAVIVSVCGLAGSWFVGAYLPRLEYDNQVAEAAFRKQLVHAEEERRLLDAGLGWSALFREVLHNCRRLYRHGLYFAVWATTYDKVMMLVPYAVCIPSMHAGTLTLGLAMQTVNAFGQVQGGLSFVLKNWRQVTRLRSICRRLKEFERAIERSRGETSPIVPHPALVERVRA